MTAVNRVAESARGASQWEYELVPLKALPEVNLAVSVKSRFIQNRAILELIRVLGRSPLTFLGYLSFEAAGIASLFLPAPIGRIVGIVGTLMGAPGTIVLLGNFRYELVVVLLKTYDICFFITISTITSTVITILYNDSRGLLPCLMWLAFMSNIFADASILGLRALWFGNVGAVVCFAAIGIVMSIQMTDQLHLWNVIETNGRALPATAVVRDGMTSLIVIVLRNMYRQFHLALGKNNRTSSVLIKCISFRCRLQLRHHIPHRRRENAIANEAVPERSTTTTQLKYAPMLGPFDIRHTLAKHAWLFDHQHNESTQTPHRPLAWFGVASFIVSVVVGFTEILAPLAITNINDTALVTVATAATTCTTLFVTLCVSAMQPKLLRAVLTSFDFLFFATQITVLDLALADLMSWRPVIVLALVSEWLWAMFLLTWDALTPYVRSRLGLTTKVAAFLATALVLAMAIATVLVFAVLPPHAIHERVLVRLKVLAYTVEFRALSWYCSSASTVFAGTARFVWRLWWATESELVLLDGPVVYEAKKPTRVRRSRSVARGSITPVSPT